MGTKVASLRICCLCYKGKFYHDVQVNDDFERGTSEMLSNSCHAQSGRRKRKFDPRVISIWPQTVYEVQRRSTSANELAWADMSDTSTTPIDNRATSEFFQSVAYEPLGPDPAPILQYKPERHEIESADFSLMPIVCSVGRAPMMLLATRHPSQSLFCCDQLRAIWRVTPTSPASTQGMLLRNGSSYRSSTS